MYGVRAEQKRRFCSAFPARYTGAMLDPLKLKDPDAVARALEMFVFEQAGHSQGVVVALSGGVDSALVLALAARALGPERVRALLLPDGQVAPESDMADVRAWAKKLGVAADNLSLSGALRELRYAYDGRISQDARAWDNLKARLRMVLGYAVANLEDRLVLGTGNRSELLLGYFTKHGDGAADALPLAGLYKTQVFQLARHLRLPVAILDKKPSAGLWMGQSDEQELGAGYATIDRVLHELVDRGRTPNQVAQRLDVQLQFIHNLQQRMGQSTHKRQPPSMANAGWGTSWSGEGG